MRFHVSVCILAASFMGAPRLAVAQVGETRVSIVVSPVLLSYSTAFGGNTGALAGDVRVTRYFSDYAGAQIAGRVIVPRSVMSATPGCAPSSGAPCTTRTTPNAFTAGVASLLGAFGQTGLRASVGLGHFRASGYESGEANADGSSLGVEAGFEWVPSGRSRFAPTIGVRAVHLASPIAGMRQIFLPGMGLTF